MIQNYFHNVKIFLGSLISNARVWAGGTRAFTLKKSAARPRSGQTPGGQKSLGTQTPKTPP